MYFDKMKTGNSPFRIASLDRTSDEHDPNIIARDVSSGPLIVIKPTTLRSRGMRSKGVRDECGTVSVRDAVTITNEYPLVFELHLPVTNIDSISHNKLKKKQHLIIITK